MKKIIFGLVLAAALILSSCDGPKGGTIIVKNEAVYTVVGADISADLKVNITSILPPVLKTGIVPKNGELSFTLDDDGTYDIALDLLDTTSAAAALAGIQPSPASVSISGGNTVTVTLKKE